ncbi:hypothetical protein [Prevotella heparinolytica]|uniref:hypothetical protein n=1 Tax=Prevotella heparinolytica TaxID=28113 RepID=UPI0014054F00|nr:hypothetical protein [Bacteroides heparinolyticus]
MRGCILSDGYFLNALFTVVRQKRREPFTPGAIPLFDSCNPLSRQTQVFKPTDTCV